MWISAARDLCEAHGQCAMASEELFPLDNDGYTTLAAEPREVPPVQEHSAEHGVASCPLQALRLTAERPHSPID